MSETESANSPLLNKAEAAKIMRVAPITVHRMIREGRLGSIRVGARVFTTRQFVDDFLAKNRREPVAA